MSIRRLNVLICGLLADRGSWLLRQVAPAATRWSQTDYILADLVDRFTAANFKEPKPYPRPGDEERAAEHERQRAVALEAQRDRQRRRELARGGDDG